MDTRALATFFVLTIAVSGVAAQESFAVVGRVQGPEGKPLAGATVLADNGGSYQVTKEWTETPWRRWVADPIGEASIGPFTRRAAAPTGDDGKFRVEGVPAPAGNGWVAV